MPLRSKISPVQSMKFTLVKNSYDLFRRDFMRSYFMKSLLLAYMLFGFAAGYSQSKSYVFVFLHKKPAPANESKEYVEKIMQGHMANIESLAKEGKLLAAGPFEGGGGIFILNTTSADEAKAWLSTDPGVKANRWEVEILPYLPRTGSVCPVKEPYEMVTYSFIRFKINNPRDKDNPSNHDLFKQHDEILFDLTKSNDTVTEAVFENSGTILILKNDLPDDKLATDEAVKQGLIIVEKKKLWIAKGSFCEK